MRLTSIPAVRPLLVFAMLALGACGERANPTQPTPREPDALIICDDDLGCSGGGGGGTTTPPISFTSLSSNPTSFPIGGRTGTYSATLRNDGSARSDLRVQGYIVQGATRRNATNLGLVSCGTTLGVLPTGTCTLTGTVGASNLNTGTGTLVPGAATFEFKLMTSTSTVTTKSIAVTLTPAMTALALASSNVDLSGAIDGMTITLQNTGTTTWTNVNFTAAVIQGAANRSGGSAPLGCPSAGWGNLPSGTCTNTFWALSVTNSSPGTGTLVPGPATVQISMLQGTTLVDRRSVNVTLVSTTPQVTSVSADSGTPLIGGGSKSFTATFSNPGVSLSGVQYQGFIRQGTTRRASTGSSVSCGSGAGVLPNGTCTISGVYAASNTLAGSGTLVPGGAIFELELRNSAGTVLDMESANVTLIGPPTIGTVTPSGSAVIGGPPVSYSATVQNPGASLSSVSAQATITQGTASRDAASQLVNCGSGDGILPVGACTFTSAFVATNATVGTGTLVPGPATLTIELSDVANGVLATQSVAITLVAATPRITSTTLSSTELTIDDFSQTYTARLDNPGPSLPNVVLLVLIKQGSTQQDAGGQTVACGPNGTDGLPTGSCDIQGSLLVIGGSLAPGAATVVFELRDGDSGSLLDTRSVPVNLLSGIVSPPSALVAPKIGG